MGAIQLFENYYESSLSAPDSILIDTFDINEIRQDFIISRDKDGKILSLYKDNVWNLKTYVSNPSQHGIIDFENRIESSNISDVKKLMFLLIVFGSGRNGSQYSVETLGHYFNDVMVPLSKFALENKTTITKIIENNILLNSYINNKCSNLGKVQCLSSTLVFLDNLSNRSTQINFQRNKDIFKLLKSKINDFSAEHHQTSIIPSRILAESIRQRWIQIEEIETNLTNLIKFLDMCIESERFASSETMINKYKWDCNKTLQWKEAINFYQLNNLFKKYSLKNRINFKGFITKIQGTCKHLLHAYTGMRNGEMLNTQSNCLESVPTNSGICRIISTTSKFTGTNQNAKWVTSKEVERIIFILRSINQVIAKHYNLNLNDLPLFLSGNIFVEKGKIRDNENIRAKRKFDKRDELPLDYSSLRLTIEDKQEIEEIDFNKNIRDLEIGLPWEFKTHQYRRSLAIYSIQSGLVSLGALQIQMKHLFREMTLYYGNGASYARKLFDIPKEHIANDLDALKPELDTLAYIKNVIFSDEKLFGAHGSFVENNTKQNNHKFKTYFLENRDKTLKQFKNGEIAYKETALGGCIATEACDSRLTRSITACFDCHGGVLKKSKVDNVIQKQKEFISFLDPSSIEYRTEVEDLNRLEELKSKLIKE
jgi:integrase